MSVLIKILIILIIIGINIFIFSRADKSAKMSYGVSFSKPAAKFLSLDWREAYLAIFDDLGAKKIRLSSYWTELEPEEGTYSFADLDWQIEVASNRRAKIILTLGQKQPRWPECHIPEWAKKLNKSERQEKVLGFVKKVVERYKNKESIAAWQVENEPLFGFGDCPNPADPNFLDQEIAEVRSLDNRPIIITDSGERSLWYSSAKRADIFGTTMYRIVWDGKWGYMTYPIPASFYTLRANLLKLITGVKIVIISELQAEAWGPQIINELSMEEQVKSMDPDKFREIVSYAKSTGFSESYFWGVEYWYWLKTVKGNDGMWEAAKKVFEE